MLIGSDEFWRHIIGVSIAVGIGLLVGAERERRKGDGPSRAAAGLRTFTITALAGAVAQVLGGLALIAGLALVIGAMLAVAYWRIRSEDPGLTTEIAMVLVLLLGALAMSQPVMAAGIGALLAGLLAARDWMHRFVRQVLSHQELHDLILFLSVALIALPLAPDQLIGPFDAINLSTLVKFVLAVMLIGSIGHVAIRLLGDRGGLSIGRFVSGFISSTATIYSMGRIARASSLRADDAAAGAILSTVATMVQLNVLVFLLSPALAWTLILPVFGGMLVPVGYALSILFRHREGDEAPTLDQSDRHAFDFPAAVLLAVGIAVVTIVSAFMQASLGAQGMLLAAATAGFADAHAMITPISGMLRQSLVSVDAAIAAILLALTTNAVTKAIVAVYAGRRAFALRILPVIASSVGGAWLGYWLGYPHA